MKLRKAEREMRKAYALTFLEHPGPEVDAIARLNAGKIVDGAWFKWEKCENGTKKLVLT